LQALLERLHVAVATKKTIHQPDFDVELTIMARRRSSSLLGRPRFFASAAAAAASADCAWPEFDPLRKSEFQIGDRFVYMQTQCQAAGAGTIAEP
jgi:hypothetical protein